MNSANPSRPNPALSDINAHNLDIFLGLLLIDSSIFDSMHYIETLNRSPKDGVFLVQPRRPLRRNKKLAAIRIWPCIRHADRVSFVMFESRKFVRKFGTPDAFTTSSITQWVAALDHEFSYHAMEDCIVVVAVLTMSDKVLHSLWGSIRKKADVDVAVGCV